MGKEIAFKFIQDIASKVEPKSARFLAKQTKDIELFGEKKVLRFGVTDDMLQAFTPFRRLSKKHCSLSDPKYFIEQYEKNSVQLPLNWSELSETQKVDLIVKERYEQIVANKIMNSLKNEPVEHSFSLASNGEILSHDVGGEIRVDNINCQKLRDVIELKQRWGLTISAESQPHSSVHVHPCQSLNDGVIAKHQLPKMYAPFSGGDLRKYCSFGEIGYVVDASGNKFKFTPLNLGRKDDTIGSNIERIYDEYERSIVDTLWKRAEITQDLKQVSTDSKTTLVDYLTVMLNMQHRKNFLQSKEVKDKFGIFEELG